MSPTIYASKKGRIGDGSCGVIAGCEVDGADGLVSLVPGQFACDEADGEEQLEMNRLLKRGRETVALRSQCTLGGSAWASSEAGTEAIVQPFMLPGSDLPVHLFPGEILPCFEVPTECRSVLRILIVLGPL